MHDPIVSSIEDRQCHQQHEVENSNISIQKSMISEDDSNFSGHHREAVGRTTRPRASSRSIRSIKMPPMKNDNISIGKS